MPKHVPDLALSHGQVISSVCYGQEPSQIVKDRIRYLRQLGTPEKNSSGRGNRRTYNFFDLAEVGVALTALSFGFRPVEITSAVVSGRGAFHQQCRDAWHDLDEGVLDEPWVLSRGRQKVIREHEYFVRAHDRTSHRFGELDYISPEDVVDDPSILLEPIERFPGEPFRRLISLSRLLPQWVAWSLQAPATKPGRKG